VQQATLTIVNRLGLHARAASKLVNVAKRYQSEIKLAHGVSDADAKSIMGVMLLAAPFGSEVLLTVTGADEAQAFEAVSQLVNDRFGESE